MLHSKERDASWDFLISHRWFYIIGLTVCYGCTAVIQKLYFLCFPCQINKTKKWTCIKEHMVVTEHALYSKLELARMTSRRFIWPLLCSQSRKTENTWGNEYITRVGIMYPCQIKSKILYGICNRNLTLCHKEVQFVSSEWSHPLKGKG